MQELHNVKGSRKNGIYVDCKQLAMRLYKLSFTMAKRDINGNEIKAPSNYPAAGTYTLKIVDGVVQWVQDT